MTELIPGRIGIRAGFFLACVWIGVLPAWCQDSQRSLQETVAGRTVSQCVAELSSEDRVTRLRAARTLGHFSGDLAAQANHEALGHSDPAVRYLAATNLAHLGGKALQEASDSLKKLAADQEQPGSVHLAVAYAQCAAGEERPIEVLIAALAHADRGTACAAADLLGRLGESAKPAEAALQTMYSKNKWGVKGGDYHRGGAAMNALRRLRGE